MTINRLVLLGDIFLGGDFNADCFNSDAKPFVEIQNLIKDDDIVIANIETTFFNGYQRPFRTPLLISPRESIRFLRDLKLDAACLANNHIMDYGTKSMMRTKKLLSDSGIMTFGAGIDRKHSLQPAIISRKGQKFGFLGFTSSAYHVNALIAGWNRPGSPPIKIPLIEKEVSKLRKDCDFVCVALHWGHEYTQVPAQKQRQQAKRIIEAGADLIIGTHPHVIQGFEMIHDKYVFYSLGNFFFPEFETILGKKHMWPKESLISMIPVLEIEEKKVNLEVEFARYENNKLILLQNQGKTEHLQILNRLNKLLASDHRNRISSESQGVIAKKRIRYFKSRPTLFLKNILFLLTFTRLFRFIDGVRMKRTLRKEELNG